MIPALVSLSGSPWDVLPSGIHPASLEEIKNAFGYNERRRTLLSGLVDGATALVRAGCSKMYLDGSFVTAKPIPGDYDACWDPAGVLSSLLDPVFTDFSDGRARQKARFGGEFFPSSIVEAGSGRAFLDFFQVEKHSGGKKGIIEVSIMTDATILRRLAHDIQ
ncbi:DUF6932 family protein [Agrobacterium tumefaciens]|uniref:DUF6932 family protein n=1 Tax=Agrobacterium tumefaciens TaxID=358 RepID=UPI000EF25691|nr:hypothetical protein [Agrobacterium tumefaciens]NSZ35729.1 hypothetical protein [Agrobacterium tumefaciens]QLG25377.1 hypothetical protein EML4_23630 [Agrobacterium tumefaciens]UXS89251.1 hypothetical protein FY144_23570 [Agrobacterium tumefaciens]